MTIVLPQGSYTAALSVATALRKEGFTVNVREDQRRRAWVVEVVGKVDPDEPEGAA